MRSLLLVILAGLVLAGCGGAEFSEGLGTSDSGFEAAVGPEAGDTATETGEDAGADMVVEAENDVAQDVVAEADSGEDAVADVAEEPDVAHDVAADVAEEPSEDAPAEVSVDAPEADVDSGPLPPCGIVPQQGWWICYVLEHSGTPQGFVGLSGGIAPSGESIQGYWNDPMYGEANTKCVSPSNLLDYVLCPLGALDSDTRVQFIAALHPNPNDGVMAGTMACDTAACSGEAFVYHDGVVVGKMLNSTPDGVLDFIPNFTPPNRLNLYFDVQ